MNIYKLGNVISFVNNILKIDVLYNECVRFLKLNRISLKNKIINSILKIKYTFNYLTIL